MSRGKFLVCSVLPLAFSVGCGGSEDFMQQQEDHMKVAYAREKEAPPRLSAKQKQFRKERLRMQYGDIVR